MIRVIVWCNFHEGRRNMNLNKKIPWAYTRISISYRLLLFLWFKWQNSLSSVCIEFVKDLWLLHLLGRCGRSIDLYLPSQEDVGNWTAGKAQILKPTSCVTVLSYIKRMMSSPLLWEGWRRRSSLYFLSVLSKFYCLLKAFHYSNIHTAEFFYWSELEDLVRISLLPWFLLLFFFWCLCVCLEMSWAVQHAIRRRRHGEAVLILTIVTCWY